MLGSPPISLQMVLVDIVRFVSASQKSCVMQRLAIGTLNRQAQHDAQAVDSIKPGLLTHLGQQLR